MKKQPLIQRIAQSVELNLFLTLWGLAWTVAAADWVSILLLTVFGVMTYRALRRVQQADAQEERNWHYHDRRDVRRELG